MFSSTGCTLTGFAPSIRGFTNSMSTSCCLDFSSTRTMISEVNSSDTSSSAGCTLDSGASCLEGTPKSTMICSSLGCASTGTDRSRVNSSVTASWVGWTLASGIALFWGCRSCTVNSSCFPDSPEMVLMSRSSSTERLSSTG